MTYREFLQRKEQIGGHHGFMPDHLPDWLYPFQAHLAGWSMRQGCAAIFGDCGLGKTPIQLAWADAVTRHAHGRVLILTPLAVSAQTVREAEKFGIPCERSRDGMYHQTSPIIVTNYQQLHRFSPQDFCGVVCDESSILKNFSGATQKAITRFALKMPYRLLCTATAAPNDYVELGTSSEALGYLGFSDMVSRFFVMNDEKRSRMNEVKLYRTTDTDEALYPEHHSYYQKLAYRVSQQIQKYRLRGHAEIPFWRWVCSWARACRKPSDLGFDDGPFQLPPLDEQTHIIDPARPADGMLFTVPAFGMQEEREERRRTLEERCAYMASLVDHGEPAIVWCHYNPEGTRLAQLIPDSIEVHGRQTDTQQEAAFERFLSGRARVLVCKPKIGAFGLNFQHCAHVVTCASHSYEQHYQAVRRCWRFGQTKPVRVDIVATVGEQRVVANMQRKADAATKMFAQLVASMNNALSFDTDHASTTLEIPEWLLSSKRSPRATPSTMAIA